MCVMFSCVFCHFPIWCPGSGVVFDCIFSCSLSSSFLLNQYTESNWNFAAASLSTELSMRTTNCFNMFI